MFLQWGGAGKKGGKGVLAGSREEAGATACRIECACLNKRLEWEAAPQSHASWP